MTISAKWEHYLWRYLFAVFCQLKVMQFSLLTIFQFSDIYSWSPNWCTLQATQDKSSLCSPTLSQNSQIRADAQIIILGTLRLLKIYLLCHIKMMVIVKDFDSLYTIIIHILILSDNSLTDNNCINPF